MASGRFSGLHTFEVPRQAIELKPHRPEGIGHARQPTLMLARLRAMFS